MSKTGSLHYELCCEAAKWLRRGKGPIRYCGKWKYVAVELCAVGAENCDVWAFNGDRTLVIEVKTSRRDFLNDKKKWWRTNEANNYKAGNLRYYLAPEGIIKTEDLPEGWGLLTWTDVDEKGDQTGKFNIEVTVESKFHVTMNTADLRILNSILWREKFPQGIYNYRNTNPKIKHE